MNLGRFKSSRVVIILVAVVAVVCVCAVLGGVGNLFGGARDLISGGGGGSSSDQGELGNLYTAFDIDQNGCPLSEANQFYQDDIVYVGLEESLIPRGTEIFMRLYYEGDPLEDTESIQASEETESCVWFQFQPTTSAGFEPGRYEAELVVNGNRTDTIQFEVLNQRAGAGGALPQTGSGSGELGRVYATTRIDQDGCPIDSVSDFYASEPVYVAVEESFIPVGTEMFARLVHDGQVLEDTMPIVADQDMQSCVWFQFEAEEFTGGLPAGNYEAELYVNGSLYDSVRFAVR